MILMEALKDLVVRVADHFSGVIRESLVDGFRDRDELHFGAEIFEDRIESFDLARISGEEIVSAADFLLLLEIFNQEWKVLVETRL